MRAPGIRKEQVYMAWDYGSKGFMYGHYWLGDGRWLPALGAVT